jgi:hypothetical protein
VAHPFQQEIQHEPYDRPKGHCAETLNSNSTPCGIQAADRSQYEEVENEDQGRRILALLDAAPRQEACRD